MGEMDLLVDRECIAAAERQRGGRPFADAVHGEHGGLLEGRGKKADAAWLDDARANSSLSPWSKLGVRSPSVRFSSRSFWNSFSLSHSGIAMRNDAKPRGAKAR